MSALSWSVAATDRSARFRVLAMASLMPGNNWPSSHVSLSVVGRRIIRIGVPSAQVGLSDWYSRAISLLLNPLGLGWEVAIPKGVRNSATAVRPLAVSAGDSGRPEIETSIDAVRQCPVGAAGPQARDQLYGDTGFSREQRTDAA